NHLPETNGWPHFDHDKFRVITLVTSCAGPGTVLIVAWADMGGGRTRIYCRRSPDNGATWEGDVAGRPLLPNVTYGDFHCFHPQVACTIATGVVGCGLCFVGDWS